MSVSVHCTEFTELWAQPLQAKCQCGRAGKKLHGSYARSYVVLMAPGSVRRAGWGGDLEPGRVSSLCVGLVGGGGMTGVQILFGEQSLGLKETWEDVAFTATGTQVPKGLSLAGVFRKRTTGDSGHSPVRTERRVVWGGAL